MNTIGLKLETIIISILGLILRSASIIFYLQVIAIYNDAIIAVPVAVIIVLLLTGVETIGFIYAIIWAVRLKPGSPRYGAIPLIAVGVIGIGNWVYYLVSSSNPLNAMLSGTLAMLPSLALVITGILFCLKSAEE